jgi:hypothetical protein
LRIAGFAESRLVDEVIVAVAGARVDAGAAGQRCFRWASARTALVVGLVALVLTCCQLPLDLMTHQVAQSILAVPFGLVGFIVARRQPRSPVGWILLAITVAFLAANEAGQYSLARYQLGYVDLPLGRLAVFLAGGWVSLLVLLPLPIGLFPDGRLSPRWTVIFRIYLADCGVFLAAYCWRDLPALFDRHIAIDSSGELASLDGSAHGWASYTDTAVTAIYGVLALLLVFRQLASYRGSTGDRRQQLKWLMAGGTIAVLALASISFQSVGFVGILALPVCMGIAILKYRLYDIDRIISRTLGYATLTALLAAFYVGIVTVAGVVIPSGYGSVGVAAATLAVAALFVPLRRRIQRSVDRRFDRARYNAGRTVDAFAAAIRNELSQADLTAQLLETVHSAVAPASASVWLTGAVT